MKTQLAISKANRQPWEYSQAVDVFRIGIVGCGPRGLYCLQSLTDQLRENHSTTVVSVVIFEPAEFPGAGNVYDPRQPSYLRMNFAAKHIDAWPRDNEHDRGRLNLVDWLNLHGCLAAGPNDFVPRAAVGNYLHDCFKRIAIQLEQQADVTIHRARVASVRRLDDGWRVLAGGKAFDFDDVVLTVGHEGWRASPMQNDDSVPPFTLAFPVTNNLGPDKVAPGSHVAIRGFGLTWIDTALAMTEGRGGEFKQEGQDWTYVPSGGEPSRLIPFSRSGRPMLAKPDESLFAQPSELDDIWSRACAAIDAVPRPVKRFDLIHAVWNSITDAAASAVNHFSNGLITPAAVQGWFEHWCREPMKSQATLAMLEQSYAVATGHAVPDVAWALGAAWRNLYAAIARCVSHGELDAEAWPLFRRIAVEMERISFGPPAENVGRILALVDAGTVDLRFITGTLRGPRPEGREPNMLCNGVETIEIDHCVNAVLPSPRELCSSGPLKTLLSDGIIQRLHGDGGIHVDRAGQPVGDKTTSGEGLSILGRATEGCVLGNDTLSRTLHDHPQRWAATVNARIKESEGLR